MPEVECLFECYKQMKKELKKLPKSFENGDVEVQQQHAVMASNFVGALDAKLASLNNMFLEREEDAVIRLDCLQHEMESCGADPEGRRDLLKRVVDHHGEVLLMAHWSVLAYTATVKILKKHHKRTGLLLRAPHLENLLSQPFCSTEIMTQLASKAEKIIIELGGSVSGSGFYSASSGEDNAGPATRPSRASNEKSGVSTAAPGGRRLQGSSSTMTGLADQPPQGSSRAGPSTHQGSGTAQPVSGWGEGSEGCAGVGSTGPGECSLQHCHSSTLPQGASQKQQQQLQQEQVPNDTRGMDAMDLQRCLRTPLPQQQQEVANHCLGPAASRQGEGQDRDAQGSVQNVFESQSCKAGSRQSCGVKRSQRVQEEPCECGEAKRSRGEGSRAQPNPPLPRPEGEEDVAEDEPQTEQQRGWKQQQQQQQGQGLGVLRRTQVALSTWSQLRTGASTPSTVINVPTLNTHLPSQNWSGFLINGGEGEGDGSGSCSAKGPEESAGRTSECLRG